MEQRNFWIMAAITLIFAAYISFFAPQPAPAPPAAEKGTAAEQAAATGDAPRADGAVAQNGLDGAMQISDIVYREIKVETPEYVAVIDEKGGRLKSLTLKKYYQNEYEAGNKETPVELMNLADRKDWPLALAMSDDGAPRLEGAYFQADAASLSITGKDKAILTMTSQDYDGLVIVRKFTFHGGSYLIDQEVTLNNAGQKSYDGEISLELTSTQFGHRKSRYNTFAGYLNGSLITNSPKKAASELSGLKGDLKEADWVGYMDQYFLTALVFGPEGAPGDKANDQGLGLSARPTENESTVKIAAAYPVNLLPGKAKSYSFNLYYGPKDMADLKASGNKLDHSVDLGWFGFLATPLAALLRMIYAWVHNYGLAIIIVTIMIKILLWPLTAKSYKSMKEMQKLQPKVQKLRDKYGDDRQAMNREIMQLYKTFKVNPMGGCLPMLLQIPFFIAFYRVLDYALELRGAPFMLWIQDLSAPDRLFQFSFSLPLVDAPTGIPVLTILMGLSMFLQQKMTPNTMGDPIQAKMMMMMPLVFMFILINMPSGLVLYWFVNNILSIAQQTLINRPSKAEAAKTAGQPKPVEANRKKTSK